MSTSVPYPPDDGRKVRTWNLLTRLADLADVTLLTWAPPSEGLVDRARSEIGDVICRPLAPFRSSLTARLGRRRRFLTGGPPPYVQALLEERMGDDDLVRAVDEVAQAHQRRPFDVMVLEEEGLAWLPLPDLDVARVVHRLNVFHRVLAESATGFVQRAVWRVERPSWQRFDLAALSSFDLAVATTRETADELTQLDPAVPTCVITNGVDTRPLRTPPSSGTDVAFLGWMAYFPNVDAVSWFAKEIWPQVGRSRDGATFRIIGREPTPSVNALGGRGVTVIGEVPDVVEACEGCRVGVAPLRAGMGIKNKTLEMMSMGLPVVTTSVGAEGIAAGPEDGLLVADDAESFARAVSDLLGDRDRADRLGTMARRFVRANHSWDAISEQYIAALHGALATRSGQRDA